MLKDDKTGQKDWVGTKIRTAYVHSDKQRDVIRRIRRTLLSPPIKADGVTKATDKDLYEAIQFGRECEHFGSSTLRLYDVEPSAGYRLVYKHPARKDPARPVLFAREVRSEILAVWKPGEKELELEEIEARLLKKWHFVKGTIYKWFDHASPKSESPSTENQTSTTESALLDESRSGDNMSNNRDE